MFCHMLQIEAGRHENLLMADCTFSVKRINVMSCLMLCPAYTELRWNYTPYIEILTETGEHKIKKLASFVYHTEKPIQINPANM